MTGLSNYPSAQTIYLGSDTTPDGGIGAYPPFTQGP